MNNTTVLNTKTFLVLGMISLCVIAGKSIAVVPTSVPFMAVSCAILFFIGFRVKKIEMPCQTSLPLDMTSKVKHVSIF